MSAGIEIYNYVSNQKGSPALYSDILANRPAAGFAGRLFISTDTLEIYRDTGAAWALISGGGGGGVNIYNSDGTLTGARTVTMAGNNLLFEGGAGTNRIRMSADAGQPRIFSFASADVARWAFRVDGAETGSNAGADWALRAYNDAGVYQFSPIAANRSTGEKTFYAQGNITAGTQAVTSVFNIAGITYGAGLTMIGGNAHAAQFNNYTLANAGNLTFASSSFVGASGNVLRLQGNASGTITMQAATPGLRTAAVSLNQIQYNTSGGTTITYTHAANIQGLGILRIVAAGSLTVTNAYGILLNDLNEYGYASTGAGALSITNRWGIYQDSTTDVNYLGGSVLIGTTTNAGYKTDINGTFRAVSTVTLSSLGGVGTRMVVADASGVLSTQAIPGGGGISGSGTTNYVAKFTGASSIGNSQLFDDGSIVRIGTTTAGSAQRLVVQGLENVISEVIGTLSTGGTTFAAFSLSTYDGTASTRGTYLAELSNTYNNNSFLGGNFPNSSVLSGTKSNGLSIIASNATGAIRFYTGGESGGSEKARIFSNGNTVIGSTTDAGVKLFVNGSGRIGGVLMQSNTPFVTGGNISEASGSLAIGTTAASSLNFYTSNSFRGAFTSTGEFLIAGTYNVLAGTNRGVISLNGTTENIIGFTNNTALKGYIYHTGTDFQFYNTTTGGRVGLYTEGTARIWIAAAGNVGIGTTNPSVNLQIGDLSSGTGQKTLLLTDPNYGLRIQGGGSSSGSIIQSVGSGVNLIFRSSNSNDSNYVFDSTGNALIGTSTDSGQRLQVSGNARIFSSGSTSLNIDCISTGNPSLNFTGFAFSEARINTAQYQGIHYYSNTVKLLEFSYGGDILFGGVTAPFGSAMIVQKSGVPPTVSATDAYVLFAKDIVAGNAAPHFLTENGSIIKLYQETTSVAAAAFTANSGTAINDASTFDGYTLKQVVKALRNLGILQ